MHDYLAALLGGALIGVAASMMLLLNGRIAGISGIVGGLLKPAQGELLWRALFVAGLAAAGVVMLVTAPEQLAFTVDRSGVAVVAAGLLVGFGTRLGSGCTSGHGVCGISRQSPRSLTATVVFIATGALSVWVVDHALGGGL